MVSSSIEVALNPELEQEIRRRLATAGPHGISQLIEHLLLVWLEQVQTEPTSQV